MSDEVELKINVPMFEVGELEVFDNHIHDIVEEYSKMLFKEKEQILTQRIIMKQEQEIERLNNIIKKGIEAINVYQNEKTLSVRYEDLKRIRGILRGNEFDLQMFEEYLQELKGDGSNGR